MLELLAGACSFFCRGCQSNARAFLGELSNLTAGGDGPALFEQGEILEVFPSSRWDWKCLLLRGFFVEAAAPTLVPILAHSRPLQIFGLLASLSCSYLDVEHFVLARWHLCLDSVEDFWVW